MTANVRFDDTPEPSEYDEMGIVFPHQSTTLILFLLMAMVGIQLNFIKLQGQIRGNPKTWIHICLLLFLLTKNLKTHRNHLKLPTLDLKEK